MWCVWGRNFKKGRNINIDTALDDRVNIGEQYTKYNV